MISPKRFAIRRNTTKFRINGVRGNLNALIMQSNHNAWAMNYKADKSTPILDINEIITIQSILRKLDFIESNWKSNSVFLKKEYTNDNSN